jgi:outer membrane protein TolC
MSSRTKVLAYVLAALALPHVANAQERSDSLRLDALQASAERNDPRTSQLAIRESQSALRLRTISNERLPSIAGSAEAQHQSVVTEFPAVPGRPAVSLLHDTYDANILVTEPLLDPSRSKRAAAERAQLARARAEVAAAIYDVRRQVNVSFFTAAALSARREAVAAVIADLEAQAKVADARVRNGAALRGELSAIRAEVLRRRQDDAQLLADRAAALRVLADLTGVTLAPDAPIALPALKQRVAEARSRGDSIAGRPELARFERIREALAREADVVAAQTRPRVSAFVRGGLGRPGLDILSTRTEPYWIGGVEVHWAPFDWGRTARDREVLDLERHAVTADAAAFRDALRRQTVGDLATIDRLEQVLDTDDEIVALREQIVREAAARFRESTITAAEYIDRQTDLLTARIDRGLHRVELEQARAAYLTTLGLQVR